MLFHVRMEVLLPPAMPAAQADELKKNERELAQSLQRGGKWRHLWRIAGQYANFSVFDVESVDELHALLTSLPLFPYMKIDINPMCRHPSSVRDTDA
ncbi:muconolactone Delta-isomerase [Duganella sp. BuS-21]|uniref:muconolactone Delta-isomerase n=1 Tax=Duganella sp. BuS-21 TaxID=2943848 RepID=UPI0035A64B37